MPRHLVRSTLIAGTMTLLSRITGLIRDIVFAHAIGASGGIGADAFYVAFRIPNFFRRLLGEGAFSQAFIPVFSEYKTRGAPAAEVRSFLDHLLGRFGALLVMVTVLGVMAAPVLVMVLSPGFLGSPEKYALTVQMLRLTFPYLLFISLVAMAAGILNTFGRFAVAAFTPILLNLCLIAAAVLLAPHMPRPVLALAWGVLAAGVAQLLFQVPFLRQVGALPRPRWAGNHEGVRRVFRLMGPAIFGVSVAQINILIGTVLASFLVTGSISWLYYADRIMEFPLGVFGIALGTVILPSLSEQHANGARQEFSYLLDWALRWVFVVGAPATVGLVVLSGPILTTLFRYGRFSAHDVIMTAPALMAYSVGLVGFILVRVLAPGFYARQDTRTPMRIGAMAMGTNAFLSLVLIYPLAHVGLALATSLAALVNAWLLFHRLRAEAIYVPRPGWSRLFFQIAGASAAMAAVLAWGGGGLGSWVAAPALDRVWRLGLWVVVGIAVYVATILVLGLRLGELLHKQHQSADEQP